MKTIMSVEEFMHWFRHARGGDRRMYYRGFLARDRGENRDTRTDEMTAIHHLANAVLRMAEAGAAALTQRKVGAAAFEYHVTKL